MEEFQTSTVKPYRADTDSLERDLVAGARFLNSMSLPWVGGRCSPFMGIGYGYQCLCC